LDGQTKCIFPNRQQPIEVRGDFAAQSFEDNIAAEIAEMPLDEFTANCENLRKMFEKPEAAASKPDINNCTRCYRQGRMDAIDEAVITLQDLYCHTEHGIDDCIAAITALKK